MPKVSNCFVAVLDGPNKGLVQEFWSHPDEIGWDKAANYSDIEIFMRSEPIPSYTSSGTRLMSLALEFMSDTRSSDDDVTKVVRFFESLTYPIINKGLPETPPLCILKIGDLLTWKCILLNCRPSFSPPFDPDTMKYHHVSITLDFREVTDFNKSTEVAFTTLDTSKEVSRDLLNLLETRISDVMVEDLGERVA